MNNQVKFHPSFFFISARILVERVSQVRNVAKNKNLRQTLSFIEEQTAALLSKQAPAVTKEQSINKNYFKKSATAIAKANEAESLRKLNELTKVSE